MADHLRGPRGWWTVTCNGIPAYHFAPDRRDLAERYATDPGYRFEPDHNEAARSMMKRQPLELPPAVTRGFMDAMNDYFTEENPTKRDAIAAHQLSVLKQNRGRRDDASRLSDVKELFRRMRDQN